MIIYDDVDNRTHDMIDNKKQQKCEAEILCRKRFPNYIVKQINEENSLTYDSMFKLCT